MKRLFFICIVILSFWSCSVEDDNDKFEFIPIVDVVIPEAFVLGETYQIDVTYIRPTTCHVFYDFYYVADNEKRTVAVINLVYDNSGCLPLEDDIVEVSFDFKAVYSQTYVFKFWQGEDEAGEDIFLTYEIPVID